MSSYLEFKEEMEKIDDYVALGYRIAKVQENLSGAIVEFEHPNPPGNMEKTVHMHVLTADGRKYFSTILIAQRKSVS
ncbi:MAG: hypothetical protein ACM32O_06250 [Clostridia bacterium]